MNQNYVLDTHKGFSFNDIFNQSFYHKWNYHSSHRQLLKLRSDNIITDDDMSVVKFLFRFTFATKPMIQRLLKLESEEETTELLDRLVEYKVLNKFILALGYDVTFPHDALNIYCLDLGGKTLLTHYSNEDTTMWDTTANMKDVTQITRDLVVGDFYIKLNEQIPEKIVYFKQNPEFRIGRTAIIPSFEMGIKLDDYTTFYYVGEVVRDYDFPMYFRDKLERLNSVFTTNAWKKYYHDISMPPSMLFLTDNDSVMAQVASMVNGTSDIKDYKLTTDERSEGPLDKAFLHLVNENDKILLKPALMSDFK